MTVTRRLALTAPLALAACGRSAPARLALIEANDHVLVPASFGGRPALALLDNGAPLTSLDRGFAKTAGLAKSTVGDALAPLDMMLGGAAVPIHPFLEDMTEAAIAADAPVKAIAGMEVFNTFIVELTFSRAEARLHSRWGYRPAAGAKTLVLNQGPPPHPGVEIAIGGAKPLRAYVDLGCSAALLVSPRLAASLGLGQGRAVSTRQVILSDAEGLSLGVSRLTSIDRLTFAGAVFRDVPIDILPADPGPFAGLDAVIGQPLLRRFDLAFDLPRRLFAVPNDRIGQAFDRRMTGLQVKPEGPALFVRHVAAGSPAEKAGFQAGVLIAAIDDAPPLMRTLRNAKAGQSLDIRLTEGRRITLVGARYY